MRPGNVFKDMAYPENYPMILLSNNPKCNHDDESAAAYLQQRYKKRKYRFRGPMVSGLAGLFLIRLVFGVRRNA
jgi:hypothetical protein